jgi:Protein of unknown function (DUF1553)/Protein of unknown function (DUF1549)/Planctomycete cytochrome C
MLRTLIFLIALGCLIGCRRSNRETDLPETVSYNFHIRPILSDRCFKCHGPDGSQRKAEFRLDTEEGAFAALKKTKGAHAFVPGKPEESEAYLRISASDTAVQMPPPSSNLKVSEHEMKLIKKWIEQGAKYQKHWAFIPPKLSDVPKIKSDWAKNEIDFFVLDKMEAQDLEPSDEATREQLLRRVSFDITGLPPSIEMQDKFLADETENAYEKIVDALLKDKSYGEKMAVHWLDVARYADTHGYQDDGIRTMWPWRDWVIHAFNQNYSYDKFLTWQLAGDLIPEANKESILATGFNRNHKITQEGGVIDEEYRIEYVTDRTNTFGKAFLALTFECAKCHDHKYDPILQKDYYSTFAFFNQLPEKGYQGDIYSGFPADPPTISVTQEDINGILNFINKKDSTPVKVMVMRDTTLRPTYLLKRGAYDQLGDRVSFGLPTDIFPFDTVSYPKNRLGLVKWLLHKDNPLTSRVFVNRVWQEFFGKGIVKTSGDFGMQGDLPTHPELLDWLAVDFTKHGWDIKRLIKQIVMSATYRQSAVTTKKHLAVDPDNIFLSRYPRMRLPAEILRDHVLASSGLLVNETGGPSVKTYQPKGIWEAATSGRGLSKYIQDHGDKLYRKSMYTFIKRTVPPPSMLIFDGSNRDQCEVKRPSTNTPLQALVMMNDPQVLEASRVLAERISREKLSDEEKLTKAFRLIVSRKPSPKEQNILLEYYKGEAQLFSQSRDKVEKLMSVGEYQKQKPTAEAAALMETVMMIYNMDEAVVK